MRKLKAIISFFLIFILFKIVSGQEEELNTAYFYGGFESRIGDYYGIGLRIDNITLDAGIGGLIYNKIKVQTANDFQIEDEKGVPWNLSFGYIIGKKKKDGFIIGATLSFYKLSWSSSVLPAPYDDIECWEKESSFDPFLGYTFNSKGSFYFDTRLGYGIEISHQDEVKSSLGTYSFKEFYQKILPGLPDNEFPEEIKYLNKVYFSVRIGYSF